MSKFDIGIGDTNVSVEVIARNATTGAPLNALVFNTPGLVCWWGAPTQAAVALPLVARTATGAHVDGGFVKLPNMIGTYRLDLPDAVSLAGNRTVHVQLSGAADMEQIDLELAIVQKIQLGTDDRVLVSSDAHTSGETVAAVAGHAAIVRAQSDAAIAAYSPSAVDPDNVGIAAAAAGVAALLSGVILINQPGSFHARLIDANGAAVANAAVTTEIMIDNGAFSAIDGVATSTNQYGVTVVSYTAADVSTGSAAAFKISAAGAEDVFLFFKLSA